MLLVLRCVVHAVHRLDFLSYFVQFSSFPVTSHRFSQVHMAQPLDVTVVLGNLTASQEKLQSEIRSVKDQLLAGQEDTAQRVAKRITREKSYDFNRKGNKRQFQFNETVVEQIEEAAAVVGSSVEAAPVLKKRKKHSSKVRS